MQIFLTAFRLGCTSFGGPVAHLAYFREEYVVRRRWLDEESYAELVALCQFLPGPASSQTGFGIGLLQRGLAGGAAAWLGFTLPSALLMIGLGYGMTAFGGFTGAGWVHGLKLAAVAVVAQAVLAMWRRLCPDLHRSILSALAAGSLLLFSPAWTQILVIAGGAIAGWLLLGHPADVPETATPSPTVTGRMPSRRLATISLVLFAFLLAGLPLLASRTATDGWLATSARFYVAGALVFGGGHVVLPLLERGVVAPGWIGREQFLAGYGAAQALPGPLFCFAGYLGTAMTAGPGGWLGGVWALAWIFLPALLLVLGLLPWWRTLRRRPGAQAALRGANAAVVGILLAALIHPIGTSTLTHWSDFAVALGAFMLLHAPRVAPWMAVVACALVGNLLG